MGDSHQYVIFILDKQRYALPLSMVERITHIVEITPLPKAPDIVIGIINMSGRIIPVFNIRQRFGLPHRETELNDHIIIANTLKRTVALLVDYVYGLIELPDENLTVAEHVLPGVKYLQGILKHEDGLILIHDIARFLSLDEEKQLNVAMK